MSGEWTPWHLERPDPRLLLYYILVAALTLIAFPITILPLYFKYHTLHYRFDDQGIKMSWGILFKREIFLTYARIQDIHLTRDLFERWLGLGSVAIQTASGSSTPEMTIVGLPEFEELRDFLYYRMRGVREEARGTAAVLPGVAAGTAGGAAPAGAPGEDEVVVLLRGIRDDLRATSEILKGGADRG